MWWKSQDKIHKTKNYSLFCTFHNKKEMILHFLCWFIFLNKFCAANRNENENCFVKSFFPVWNEMKWIKIKMKFHKLSCQLRNEVFVVSLFLVQAHEVAFCGVLHAILYPKKDNIGITASHFCVTKIYVFEKFWAKIYFPKIYYDLWYLLQCLRSNPYEFSTQINLTLQTHYSCV
jgi:hypothetical protein